MKEHVNHEYSLSGWRSVRFLLGGGSGGKFEKRNPVRGNQCSAGTRNNLVEQEPGSCDKAKNVVMIYLDKSFVC